MLSGPQGTPSGTVRLTHWPETQIRAVVQSASPHATPSIAVRELLDLVNRISTPSDTATKQA